MSQATMFHSQPLEKSLRKKLETAVKAARDEVESGARAACTQLGVGAAKADSHLSEDEKDLRRRLRIHGRQLGDVRGSDGKQQVDRLVEEIGYEHWHRMLFARFLAESQLLMYPDPDQPVAISLEECDDLATDEGAKNGWELAAQYAAKMLPQIFRVDSPVFSVSLPTESQQELEKILAELPSEVFQASDSLGWVYQFWQAKRKDEVNASEVKIGARELPAVTQLFTEPYMVSFLLDNSLGAWWAGKRLTQGDLAAAENEQELRDKLALPGVPLEYLRFVRTEPGNEAEGEENTGPWTPAAGTFDAWPESLAELKTLDPCCGSGHFLVAALLMLTPMRMELEGLSAKEAVDRVLAENLHGLEIDQRCVELAAFALALTAWRFPEAGGYRVLPDLNVACCGLSVSVAKEEWKELAKDNKQLRIALDWMYDEFKDAPVLGSLLNPAESMAAKVVEWDDLSNAIRAALAGESSEKQRELGVTAQGLSVAAAFLSQQYHVVATNVPYLVLGKQHEVIKEFAEDHYHDSRNDLATIFISRMLQLVTDNGVVGAVSPQNWLFQPRYKKLRKRILINNGLSLVARLGAGAFETISGEIVKATLGLVAKSENANNGRVANFDVSEADNITSKASLLRSSTIHYAAREKYLHIDSYRITVNADPNAETLSKYATTLHGQNAGDNSVFNRMYWEVAVLNDVWECYQNAPDQQMHYGGRSQVILWEKEDGRMARFAESVRHLNHKAQQWRSGKPNWGKKGVAVSLVGRTIGTFYAGDIYGVLCGVLIPINEQTQRAIWAFVDSGEMQDAVRELDPNLAVQAKTLLQVPFDLAHWQQVAAEKYPHGLPEPYSDDPTQWIFHGHPASSEGALQVAVARLLGYQWPAELDSEMELARDAREWVERSCQLTDLADNDGIVCIPAVGTEQPAEDRLLNVLHHAYEDGRAQEKIFRDKLAAADENDPVTVDLWRRGWEPSLPESFATWRDSLLEAAGHRGKTLESWLRDKFFIQHCKQFHHRPFIWHVWDGLKDGFSALINYHKLDYKLLETLIYTYLNDWITKQKNSSEDGSEEKLAAAEHLKVQLEKILEGESPHDIFVRWKPLEEQPIGWNPDLNDGVRLNIRPWMTVGDIAKRGAGLLRDKPNIKWTKDRGKDVESAPWYNLGPEYGGKDGDRINDHHLALAEKKAARKKMEVES